MKRILRFIASLRFTWVAVIWISLLTHLPYWIIRTANYHRSITSSSQNELGIAKVISDVRQELIASHKNLENSGSEPLFYVKSFDLEITFVIKKSVKEEGKFEYEVVTVNSASEVASEHSQKVTIHLDACIPRTACFSPSGAGIDPTIPLTRKADHGDIPVKSGKGN